MKKSIYIGVVLSGIFLLTAFTYPAEKLLDPLKLVDVLKSTSTKKPIIYNVGPSAMIPGSVLIGETINPANQTKLKTSLILLCQVSIWCNLIILT